MMKKLMIFLPIIAGILWGSAGVFVRKLYDFKMDNLTILSSRVLVATIIMFFGILIYNKSFLKIKLKDAWVFIAGGILGMLGLNYCYNEAINRLTLSFSAILLSLSPIFVMIWGAILFREKVTTKKIYCTILAILGCVLTSGILESTVKVKWSAIAIFIGVLSAFFYALYSVFSKIAMERGYNVFTITFYSMLTITVVLLPLTNWSILREFLISDPIGNSVFMVFHSICTSILPYIFYTVSLSYIETGKAAILASSGEPTAALIFGIIFFLEVPSILSLLGVILTIIAISLLCKPDKKIIKD